MARRRKNIRYVQIGHSLDKRTLHFLRFSWLAIFETGRDGTVLTCLVGKQLKTGRDGTVK